MKTPVSPHTVAFLLLAAIAPIHAQSLDITTSAEVTPLSVSDLEGRDLQKFSGISRSVRSEVSAVNRTPSFPNEARPVYVSQDLLTLGSTAASGRPVESVVDFNLLRQPSPFRKSAVRSGTSASEAAANDLPSELALISATYRAPAERSADGDCDSVALSISQRVKLDPSLVLEIVESEVAANPGCACEIVKAAIVSSGATESLVSDIVETAIIAAPETMRIVSQCAIAASPESLAGVQAVLAKFDSNRGEGGPSSKSAKSGKEVVTPKAASVSRPPLPDPLDLPPPFPPIMPPPVYPPLVTDDN